MDHQEHESLVNELAKRKKLAEELAGDLGGTSTRDINDRLVQRILASYEEALNLLTRPEPKGQRQSVISSASDTSAPSVSVYNDTAPKDSSIGPLKRKSIEEDIQNLKTTMSQERQPVELSLASRLDDLRNGLWQNLLVPSESDPQEKCQSVESSLSDPSATSSSVLNATPSKDSRSRYTRRSRQDVRSMIISTSEGTTDDGYAWRKYGEKELLGSKYPRSYFRCSHRHDNGCLAVKQMQRSDNDPTIFDVTYRGVHTCKQANVLASKPKSEEKAKPKSEENARVISQGSNSVGSSTLWT